MWTIPRPVLPLQPRVLYKRVTSWLKDFGMQSPIAIPDSITHPASIYVVCGASIYSSSRAHGSFGLRIVLWFLRCVEMVRFSLCSENRDGDFSESFGFKVTAVERELSQILSLDADGVAGEKRVGER
jgi:hypothetical protein